ncbi:MAG: alpha/beta hydrolase, partial [Gammaproteobacteria bacterium]
ATLNTQTAETESIEVEPGEQNDEMMATDAPYFNDYVSGITTVICPFKEEIDYEVGRVKCGFIMVPENREKPGSRMIRVLFAHIVASGRLPSDDDEDSSEEPIEVREDPIAYLTGGPGVGIEPYVTRFLEHDLTKTRDMYILNQRGISNSGQFCPFFSLTNRESVTAVSLYENEAEEAERTKACFASATARGIDLTGYNTVENARDVRALRLALGFDSWNVWGISYGSHLGQMLTQVDEEGIRALVLDAIVPNDLGDLMRIHRWVARNHDLVFAECDRQEASICEGLRERFIAAYNSMVDNPMTVPALDEEIYPAGVATPSALIIGFATFAMQYEQDEHPAIPSVMRAMSQYAEDRDEEIFQAFTVAGGPFSGLSAGMAGAVRCNDGYVHSQAEVAEEDLQEDFGFKQGLFTIEGAQLQAQACEDSGLAPRDRADYQPVKTSIPTLIINGDWDPITPPALAEHIAPGFENGRLIIVPYAGHGPTRSMPECAGQVMNDFYDDPTQDITQLDATCFEEGVDAPEFLDYTHTDATLRLLTRFSDDPKRLVMPGLSLGFVVIVLATGLIAIILGAFSRRLSSHPEPSRNIGPNTPRLLGFITAALSIIGLSFIGAGFAATIEVSELSVIAGIAPPAGTGALLIFLSALMGLATIYSVFNANKSSTIRRRTIIGLPLIGICAVLLMIILASWGITVW